MAIPLWNDTIADGSHIDAVEYQDKFRRVAAERRLTADGEPAYVPVADGDVLEQRIRNWQNPLQSYGGFMSRVPDDDEPFQIDPYWLEADVYTEGTFTAVAFGDTGPTRKYFKAFADNTATEYVDGSSFADGDFARDKSKCRTYERVAGQWVWAHATLPDVVTVVQERFRNYPTIGEIPWLHGDDLIDTPTLWNQMRDAYNVLYVWSYISVAYGGDYTSTNQGVIGGSAPDHFATYADAVTAAQGFYAGLTGSAGVQAGESYAVAYNSSDVIFGPEFSVYVYKSAGQVGPAEVKEWAGQNRDLTFYAAHPLFIEGTVAIPGSWNETFIFDNNGAPVVNGVIHAFDHRVVVADTTSIVLGNMTVPNTPAAAPPAAGDSTRQGYNVAYIPWVCRGDVAGGFEFSSISTT